MHELFVFGPTDLCRAKDADDSLPPIICVQLHCVKIKINDESFVSALRDVKAEFLITSLHVVG